MKRILIYIAVFCILVYGCEPKEKESLPYTEVYGKVVSTGSQKAIDSVRVSIWDGFGTATQSNYDTTYTDKNGNFHIVVHGNEPVLFLYKKGYEFNYSYGGAALGVAPLIPGKKYNNEIFSLDGEAGFNPILMNKLSMSNEDKVKISVYSKWGNPYVPLTYWGNGPHPYTYSLPNGELVLGDSYVRYKLEITKSNVLNTIIDSVYVTQGKVYRDTIYY